MTAPSYKTYTLHKAELDSAWRIVDADGLVLGRMASQIAIAIRGKDKPTFTPHMKCGDHVVVVNAEKVRLTGNKLEGKIYHRHTGFRGGVKSISARHLREEDPEEMIRLAVWGMLPKGPLGREMIKMLRVYRGPSHPHEAQNPKPLTMNF